MTHGRIRNHAGTRWSSRKNAAPMPSTTTSRFIPCAFNMVGMWPSIEWRSGDRRGPMGIAGAQERIEPLVISIDVRIDKDATGFARNQCLIHHEYRDWPSQRHQARGRVGPGIGDSIRRPLGLAL